MHTIFWLENLKRRCHSGDLGMDGKIVFNISYGDRLGRCGLDSSGSGQGSVAVCC